MRFVLFGFLFFAQSINSQDIHFLRTFYADDFRDWLFYNEDEIEIGTLRARWQLTSDYTQWDVRIGERSGSILLRWDDRPNEWEIRIQNDFLSASPTWPGQFDSWRITDHATSYYLNLIKDPEGIQWVLTKDQDSICYFYNAYLNDLRDWSIEYQNIELNSNLIITALFLSTYYSTPK